MCNNPAYMFIKSQNKQNRSDVLFKTIRKLDYYFSKVKLFLPYWHRKNAFISNDISKIEAMIL